MIFAPRTVKSLQGRFVIPGYQRGYRWTEIEVRRLLDDIEQVAPGQNYCLQPIVVKLSDPMEFDPNDLIGEQDEKGAFQLRAANQTIDEKSLSYELVDGQQRLTTLYLIALSLKDYLPKAGPTFTLSYETRPRSAAFLQKPTQAQAEENIDFHYIHQAYQNINSWLEAHHDPTTAAIELYNKLSKEVKVLWYVDTTKEAGQKIFQRLNIGRLPLTNAELVKALFLSQSARLENKTQRQALIALQWDEMETQLRDLSFWYFLTNTPPEDYPARIDLLMSFVADSSCRESHDTYAVFNHFDKLAKDKSLGEVWDDIYHQYQLLRQAYHNREFYHRAGFLVATGEKKTILDIIRETQKMSKKERLENLNTKVKERLPKEEDLDDLLYGKDNEGITCVLLWMNIILADRCGDSNSRFPFDAYKRRKGGWSLEHIHAQQSLTLNRKEQWVEWLRRNVAAVRHVPADRKERAKKIEADIEAIVGTQDNPKTDVTLTKPTFDDLATRLQDLLSESDKTRETHSITNLTLLAKDDNTAIGNDLFATKREAIKALDMKGSYIPPATRNVFVKYYTPSEESQPYFWGTDDRKAYLQAIIETVYKIKDDDTDKHQ